MLAFLLANRTAAEFAGVLLLLLGFMLYERHAGAEECKAADVAHVAAEETHNAVVQATDTAVITQETQTYVTSTALPALPVPALRCVRVDPAPRPVPKAAAARPGSDAPAVLPVPDPADAFDPGPRLGRIGQAADAQVVELQDYISRVCLATR